MIVAANIEWIGGRKVESRDSAKLHQKMKLFLMNLNYLSSNYSDRWFYSFLAFHMFKSRE